VSTITWVKGEKRLTGFVGQMRVFRIQEEMSLFTVSGRTSRSSPRFYYKLYDYKGHCLAITLDLDQACQRAEETFSDLELLSLLAERHA